MRNAILPLISLISILALHGPAHAQELANKTERDVAAANRMAGEYIDLGEYKTARESLTKSIGKLKDKGSAARPVAADTHALLAVVYVLGFKDSKLAMTHFATAIRINKDVTLPKQANDRAKVLFGKAMDEVHPKIDCDKLMGVSHEAVAFAQEGSAATIQAKLGKLLRDGPVMVLYRGPKGGDFKEVAMAAGGDCTYSAEIPGDAISAPKLEYYVEARLKDGRLAARKGKPKTPFVVNVSFGPAPDQPTTVEEANPEKAETKPEKPKDEVEDLLLTRPKEPKKGSGCAGCAAGSEGGATWLLALGVALILGRRGRLA
jgi:hypothetical protein